jgi:hypothetical protein
MASIIAETCSWVYIYIYVYVCVFIYTYMYIACAQRIYEWFIF